MSFIRTTSINKLLKLTKRKRVIQGGTSAGKTFGILPVLIDYAIKHPRTEISVVSESIPHLRRGAIKDFLKILDWTKRYREDYWNKTLLTYTFENGSYIEFFSADQESKLRGARRNILYINEANNVSFEAYHQLAIRTNKYIWIDFNPTTEFWAHSEVLKDDDAELVVLTYKDNESLSESIVKDIEASQEKAKTSTYWENWWKVYGLGQIGSVQGVVFGNWESIDNLPDEARLVSIGLDFGYSVDPTACVGIYKYNDYYILDELIYQKELSNRDIYHKLKDFRVMTVCDSAEPKSIAELQSYGLLCMGALKGKDSILHGIQLIQQQKLLVTKRSTNLIKELRGYIWEVDRNNKATGQPIAVNNHCFVGDTLITTINGDVKIKDIKEGDLVLTRAGYKRVLKKWNNGLKQVNKYSLHLDTETIYLECTNEHLIYAKKWTQISKLKSGMTISLINNSMVKSLNYTLKKNTLVKEIKECTLLFGYFTIIKSLMNIMFTISMKTLGIIGLKICNLLKKENICQNMENKDSKTTQNGQMNFMQKELKLQKNGINQKKEENGIVSMEKNVGLVDNIKIASANNVAKSTLQGMEEFQSFATKTAKLKHLEIGEEKNELVYDLMIEGQHEYFANGILVHNCVDALRYGFTNILQQPGLGTYTIR